MFELLIDYVADERMGCRKDDPERRRLLSDLLGQLRALEARLPRIPMSAAVQALRDIDESADPELAGDTVMAHLRDCIVELEKVANGS